jgi:hypothetical protein
LEASITSFCTTYRIDPSRCAKELFTFAPSFSKLNRSLFVFPKEREEDFHDADSEEEYYDENDHDDLDHNEESDEDTSYDAIRNKDVPSFLLEALRILSHSHYHLVDAYLTLYKVYLQSVSVLPLLSAHS